MEKIVVAVKGSKKMPKTALVWALTHVVQPGHDITLLVVFPSESPGRKLWGFPLFARDCASGHGMSHPGASSDKKVDASESYSKMILGLHDLYDANKINLKVKLVFGRGSVAAEAKEIQASWVILDKQLKHEEKLCLEDLHCNIVVMTRLKPKVRRVNLVGSFRKESEESRTSHSNQSSDKQQESKTLRSVLGLVGTAASSPDQFTTTENGTSSLSGSDPGTSPFFIPEISTLLKERLKAAIEDQDDKNIVNSKTSNDWHLNSTKYGHEVGLSGNVREAVSLTRHSPAISPPLCSICQHKAPVFGKPPTWFTYAELALATGGFSRANFLAEGGFGSVYRGVLTDGQAVAIKQHKLASSQGDKEFCSEVEVLSCAQHRNVVMLVGLCIEDGRRLLVYEYVCNNSLDIHLYGHGGESLEWSSRQKIAVGAARGLRYLHEECRVGCIVHRDMRPNNILLTHDFEPLVGDFGLARWQEDGDKGVETRVIGTFGYMAPEYTESGQITEKTDVYSFGVVLVELVTGRKAVDLNRPKGQQRLIEWARPLLEEYAADELLDPRLENCYSEHELYCMLHAASLCISPDPHSRPRMSQVLHILEGNMIVDSSHLANSSGHFHPDQQCQEFSKKLCIDTVRHSV